MTDTHAPPAEPKAATDLRYLAGFGNHHVTEAVAGALPDAGNSPQQAPLGLYAEQISGTAFTAPRSTNRRTWVYRIRPSAAHPNFAPMASRKLRGTPFDEQPLNPNRLRWSPFPVDAEPADFVDGLLTIGGCGDSDTQSGVAIHMYLANRSMEANRVFVNADGEILLVPQLGGIRVHTELGILGLEPGEIAVIPRGIRFRVVLTDACARGYVLENFGAMLTLPERGPIGANGLANERDFLAPVAAYEDVDTEVEVVQKYGGHLWSARYGHTPLDVVAWHGNYAPYKYDLSRFMVIGSTSFDHPDPSIYTVLTSPSDIPGTANADFVIFPPRWLVMENTFRPPWYHRNVMTEFMGLVHGVYDAKADGFLPGGASLHNSFTSHGPDESTYDAASTQTLAPQKVQDTLAFMFETRLPIRLTDVAAKSPQLHHDYDEAWSGIKRGFHP